MKKIFALKYGWCLNLAQAKFKFILLKSIFLEVLSNTLKILKSIQWKVNLQLSRNLNILLISKTSRVNTFQATL